MLRHSMTRADRLGVGKGVGYGVKRSVTGVNQNGIPKRGAQIWDKGVRDYIIFPSCPQMCHCVSVCVSHSCVLQTTMLWTFKQSRPEVQEVLSLSLMITDLNIFHFVISEFNPLPVFYSFRCSACSLQHLLLSVLSSIYIQSA